MSTSRICSAILIAGLFADLLLGSTDSIGPNGINSATLGLDGSGIGIGMVEGGRAGKPGFDTDPMQLNTSIEPEQVFVGDNSILSPMPNDGFIDNHSELVAGVMISTDDTDHDNDMDFPIGVSTGAQLYSATFNPNLMVSFQINAAVAANHLATLGSDDIRAINMSFGMALESGFVRDGNSHLTQFIDWSAANLQHDVLYVIGGEQEFDPSDPIHPVPTDNFNGMTIAASKKVDGVYRRVADADRFFSPPSGDRTFVSLLAPGANIEMAALGNAIASDQEDDGTSFAAPHVVGTVALLQEHAEAQILAGAPNWGPNARRHEVMKAVLMNSADKIQGILGMERTVLMQEEQGQPDKNWFDSPAHNNPAIPLDVQMGAGHLNAKRALQQFTPGESDVVGSGQVPLIGWDLGVVDLDNEVHKYVFDQELQANDYVSITLAWDRDLVLEFDDGPTPGEYDAGETFTDFGIINIDLYLLEAGATDTINPVWASTSSDSNLEHIFAEIPATGNYEFWVQMDDPSLFPFAQYAVAWWAGPTESPMPQGDYDGNGSVDMDDYNLWVANFGSMTNLDADGNGNGIIDAADYTVWRDNFGAGSGSGTANVPEPSALALFLIAGLFINRQRSGFVFRNWLADGNTPARVAEFAKIQPSCTG